MKRTRKQSTEAPVTSLSHEPQAGASPERKKVRVDDGDGVVNETDVAGIMKALSAKSDWQRKIQDRSIRAKWYHEALAQGASQSSVREALSRLESMPVAPPRGESKVPSDLRCTLSFPPDTEDDDDFRQDDEDYGEPAPRGDVLWQDGLVPDALRAKLEARLDAIAAAPDKDFHPDTDGKVQDLIHPSLYPYVRGISYEPGAKDTDVPRPKKSLRQPKKDSEEEEEEKEEEEEENEGDDSLLDLGGDPETEREFELKEKELREDEDTSDYQWLPAEFFVNAEGQVSIESYINNLDRKQHPELYENIAAIFGHFLPLFEGVLKNSLTNRRLQVIVKAANYILQPGQSYEGTWHVEGMANEKIAASGIYYYSTTPNLDQTCLAFRLKRDNDTEARANTQNWGFSKNLGKADTPAGRCLVFKNNLQHKVIKFKNKSQEAGVRKILCFFLVSPTERIKSSADIPEQQWDKVKPVVVRTLLEACVSSKVHLPREIIAMILRMAKWGFTLEEAKSYRKVLMLERKYLVQANNELWERPFSFCEH